MNRDLTWEGCLNARDLGGLYTADGSMTTTGAIVRSDNPAFLTSAGWRALRAYGIRTIVALRTEGTNDDEIDPTTLPADISMQHVFVEDGTDPEFVERCVLTGRFGSPLYFADMLEYWPDRCAAAVAAIADAPPGGVAISCGRGCDRTGLVAFLLLGLVDVPAADIAADWTMSVERLRTREPEYEAALIALLERENSTVVDAVAATLDRFDIAGQLTAGGVTREQLDVVRQRLIAPVSC